MSGRPLRSARRRWIPAAALALLVLAGCSSTPAATAPAPDAPSSVPATVPATTASTASVSVAGPSSASSSAVRSTEATSAGSPSASAPAPSRATRVSTRPPATVTRTRPGATVTVTVAAPKATPEPAATDGACPYLSADVVSEITGQHHGPTQVIPLAPHPVCVFYRSDGGRMGSVRVIQAGSAAAAAAAVDQHVPVAGSQPATQPTGWTGGSKTSPGQMTQDSQAMSVYAVSRGTVAVVAEENESPSLKARLMAVCAIYGLGLEPGPAPDYCADPQQ